MTRLTGIVRMSILSVIMTACGGGGGGLPIAQTSTGIQAPDDLGCTQEYYQTMIGSYSGTVLMDRSIADTRQLCEWEVSLSLVGQSILNGCVVRATTSASVTQMQILSNNDPYRYQCLTDNGMRLVTEPLRNTTDLLGDLPGFNNSAFPVQIDIFPVTNIDSGPYFGNESVLADYFQLFDGIQRTLAERVIVEGDGTISLRNSGGQLMGTLVKERTR